MARPILIASRDASLRQSRSRLLRDAGYTTIRIGEITLACSMARFGAIGTVVLDWTFDSEQQAALIYALRQLVCRVHVICLRNELSDPQLLLNQCARCEDEHVGGCVHFLQGQGPTPRERNRPAAPASKLPLSA